MKKQNHVTEYEFAYEDSTGRTRVGSYYEASESTSSHIAAVKVIKKRGKEVSRDQVVMRGTWVANDDYGYERAIAARNAN